MRKIIRISDMILTAVSAVVFFILIYLNGSMPGDISVLHVGKIKLDAPMHIPVSGGLAGKTVTAASSKGKAYDVDLKLLGIIPIKSARVTVVERSYVIPGGESFGVRLYTRGVVVVGMSDVDADGGGVNPAKNAGLREGDVILSIAGNPVNSTEDVAAIFEGSNGEMVTLQCKRKNGEFNVEFSPVYSKSEQRYKAGLWVRDSSAGIGTMSFYVPAGNVFAGLGHGICDVDTGGLLPLMSGDIVKSRITGCYKGANGAPGELCGVFESGDPIGTLTLNSEIGVYGKLLYDPAGEAIPVALPQEISTGRAQIITTVDGTQKESYDAEITKIYYNGDGQKNMVIKITDGRLLEKTGGIVQGMSGSPIIQNGMLAGVITHVFVNNPSHGYAIFAQNMADCAAAAEAKQTLNKAS